MNGFNNSILGEQQPRGGWVKSGPGGGRCAIMTRGYAMRKFTVQTVHKPVVRRFGSVRRPWPKTVYRAPHTHASLPVFRRFFRRCDRRNWQMMKSKVDPSFGRPVTGQGVENESVYPV